MLAASIDGFLPFWSLLRAKFSIGSLLFLFDGVVVSGK